MIEELFKKNFPEYVTEKGMCLSPFYDLFSAGIECATDELNKGCIQTLTKENAELKVQIEKMKCCENCKYNSYWGNELHCNYGLEEALQEDKLVECNKMDKWEIKEK